MITDQKPYYLKIPANKYILLNLTFQFSKKKEILQLLVIHR